MADKNTDSLEVQSSGHNSSVNEDGIAQTQYETLEEEKEAKIIEESTGKSSDACKTPTLTTEQGNFKPLYQGRSQPCLPHVLSDYGMETNRQKKKKLSAQARREKRKKRKSDYLDGDDERDKEKEKLKEEKYLSVVDDLHKLRNYYYREYRDLLTDKIVRQRQEIKERSEAMLQQSILDEKQAKQKDNRKLTKHTFIHDEEFLKNIPKTNMSKIVNLQTKLQKQGKLKTQSDIDEFWISMKNPDVFALYFNVKNGLATSPDHSVFSDFVPGRSVTSTRPLSQINESAESSRPATGVDNWAVTQHYKHQHKQTGVTRQKTNSSLAKQAASNMEKRCPMIEMPPLHCFTMDLSAKPPDPEVTSKKVQLKSIEKHRKKFMGKLHKMHQLAMANHALASRILDQHEDMTMFLQGPDLSDLISDYYYNKPSKQQVALQSPPTTAEQLAVEISANNYPVLPDIPSRESSMTSQLSLTNIDNSDKTPSRKAVSDTSESKLRMIMEKPSVPLPLTMSEVMQQCQVVETNVLSTNWNNYLRAGKAI